MKKLSCNALEALALGDLVPKEEKDKAQKELDKRESMYGPPDSSDNCCPCLSCSGE